jgi:tetratricopeptide (TPR) repeat protein
MKMTNRIFQSVGVPPEGGIRSLISRLRRLTHSCTLKKVGLQLCVFTCIVGIPHLKADDFQTGISAYENAEYSEAVEAFKSVLSAGENAAARHNLALSYFQLGQPAQATWEMERAVRLDPLNQEYLFKLGALRQQLGLYALPAQWWQSAARLLPQSTWTWILSLSAWGLLAAILLPKLAGSTRPIWLKLLMGFGLAVLLISSAALTILIRQQATGIVISNEATALHHAPASAAPESGLARPGERARLLDAHGNFLKIETEAQLTGWITKDAFAQLDAVDDSEPKN